MKPYAILLFIPFLAACPALDAIEGKPSPTEAAQEHRAALTMPERIEVEPVLTRVAFVQPVQPECFEEWRIRRCGPEGELPW